MTTKRKIKTFERWREGLEEGEALPFQVKSAIEALQRSLASQSPKTLQ